MPYYNCKSAFSNLKTISNLKSVLISPKILILLLIRNAPYRFISNFSCVYFYLFCVAFDLCIVWETNQSMFLYLRLILSPLFAFLLKGKYLLLLGSFTQNLYWKLGQLVPSFWFILAYLKYFFSNKTFLFFKIESCFYVRLGK